MSNFQLRYSHNIIEHLGLKLYQNKPTNVIAELISNAWDADAQHVWIDINKEAITVADDGHGMSTEILQNHYLIISKPKRSPAKLDACSPEGRKFMGRKGIGKLAPFGIAKRVNVITLHKGPDEEPRLCWFIMDLNKIIEVSLPPENAEKSSYEPQTVYKNASLSEINTSNQYVNSFLHKAKLKGTGTLILLENLSLRKEISLKVLKESVGRRFTVTLMRNDFSVLINGYETTEDDALPKFYYRIPEKGMVTEAIEIADQQYEIKYWVGFVKSAQWPQDQAGVGIYAHGKIAQDRPFFFGIKGKEIFTRYMYAVIEADWLDELPEDVVSTDRTTINWEIDETEVLYTYGKNLVRRWISEYEESKKEQEKIVVLENISSNEKISKIRPFEKEQIVNIITNLGPAVIEDKELQNGITEQLALAITHHPTREFIKKLWDSISKNIDNNQQFLATIEQLNEYLVPEALSLSVVTAQRIYAINKLYHLKANGKEIQLQKLLEEFSWIISPDMARLTANQKLKTTIDEATKMGSIPSHGAMKEQLENDSNLRPDFVFFTNAEETIIKIIELKSPQIQLEVAHRIQLTTYLDYLSGHYNNSKISGILVGRKPIEGFDCPDIRITVMTWEDIFANSRKEYLDFLAAMLHGADEYPDDPRIRDVMDFGGKETTELLKRMADANESLKNLMDEVDKKTQ